MDWSPFIVLDIRLFFMLQKRKDWLVETSPKLFLFLLFAKNKHIKYNIPHNEASNLHAFIERCFMVHTGLTHFQLFTIKLHILGWLEHGFLLENTISAQTLSNQIDIDALFQEAKEWNEASKYKIYDKLMKMWCYM